MLSSLKNFGGGDVRDSFREILRLESVRYLKAAVVYRLLQDFETAEDVQNAPEEVLLTAGLNEAGLMNLREFKFNDAVYFEQIEKLNKFQDFGMVTVFDEKYPQNLKNIYDPPLYLFYEGALSEKDEISIAVVGSRSVSHSGKYVIGRLARELACAGFVIVSGLAMGADTAAHEGALQAEKRTVAVLGSGIECEVNTTSRRTRRKMVEKGGAIFSPFLIGTQPAPYTFPARNRVISGMSLGVVIGEAKMDSGSLITANYALEQGREVFAVPNEIFREKFEGGNNLIKTSQAKLIMSADDVMDEMPERIKNLLSPSAKSVKEKLVKFGDEAEEKIYGLLIENKMGVDEISESLSIDTGTIMSKLFMLELNGLIMREQNNVFSISRK
jgi:DNA processing protein